MNRNRLILALWASLGALWAQTDINVNSRYTVESVEISGGNQNRISRSLREDIESLVGKRLNQESLEKLARRIRTELHARLVAPKVTRGTESERVIVLFDVKGKRYSRDLDLSVPRGIYHSRHGWSGILDARFSVGNSQFNAGVANDGDQLIERYAGVRAGYLNRHVFSDRVRLGFQFASYHTQWDQRYACGARNRQRGSRHLPHAPGFRPVGHLRARRAADAFRRRFLSALPETVPGRAYRGRQRRNDNSALRAAFGGFRG